MKVYEILEATKGILVSGNKKWRNVYSFKR